MTLQLLFDTHPGVTINCVMFNAYIFSSFKGVKTKKQMHLSRIVICIIDFYFYLFENYSPQI